jgi:hypothetical protein
MKGGYRAAAGDYPRTARRPAMDLSTDYMPAPIGDNSVVQRKTPLEYLVDLYNDPTVDPHRRDRASIACLPYLHRNLTKVGKKEQAEKDARAVSSKFAVPRVEPLSPTATPTPINVRDFAS